MEKETQKITDELIEKIKKPLTEIITAAIQTGYDLAEECNQENKQTPAFNNVEGISHPNPDYLNRAKPSIVNGNSDLQREFNRPREQLAKDIIKTIIPTTNPLKTPPVTYPVKIIQFGVGLIKSSSILLWNLLKKKVETTFVKEFVIMAIITIPGTINSMYENPSMFLTCEPINCPKIMKYNVMVIAEGNNVCTQIRNILFTSLSTIVLNAI